jgi:hypothetical protein
MLAGRSERGGHTGILELKTALSSDSLMCNGVTADFFFYTSAVTVCSSLWRLVERGPPATTLCYSVFGTMLESGTGLARGGWCSKEWGDAIGQGGSGGGTRMPACLHSVSSSCLLGDLTLNIGPVS